MKRYFKNLLTALCGNDPFQMELDKVKEEMEKAGENVRMLQEAYHNELELVANAQELMHKTETMLEEQKGLLMDYEKQRVSYQKLVETLRGRVDELKAERKQLATQLAQKENDYYEAWENLRKSREVNKDLTDRLAEKDAEIKSLRADRDRQAENYEKRIGGYATTVNMLQKKIKELQDTKTEKDEQRRAEIYDERMARI